MTFSNAKISKILHPGSGGPHSCQLCMVPESQGWEAVLGRPVEGHGP